MFGGRNYAGGEYAAGGFPRRTKKTGRQMVPPGFLNSPGNPGGRFLSKTQ